MKLVEITLSYGKFRENNIYAKFLATDRDLRTLNRLDGFQIPIELNLSYLSDRIDVFVNKDDIKIIDVPEHEIDILQKHIGKYLIGPAIMQHVFITELFEFVFYDYMSNDYLRALDDDVIRVLDQLLIDIGIPNQSFHEVLENRHRKMLAQILDLKLVDVWYQKMTEQWKLDNMNLLIDSDKALFDQFIRDQVMAYDKA